MQAMGVVPDVVIVRHAYIYTYSRLGFRPHIIWNIRILLLSYLDRFSSRHAIAEWHRLIRRVSHGVKTLKRKKDRLWLRFTTEDAANYAAQELKERASRHRHFQVFLYKKEVDVRSVPFTKGMAVGELARHLKLSRDQVLCIGNGHNDISSLDGEVARHTGCPANADAEVMAVVHKTGGHIAGERSLRGVIEILDAYRDDKVNSELPVWWEDPADGSNPSRRPHRHAQQDGSLLRNALLLGAAAYTVLLVFASFGLAPASDAIMRPYRAVLHSVERVFLKVWDLWFA